MTSVVSMDPRVVSVDLLPTGFVLRGASEGTSRLWVELGNVRDAIRFTVMPVEAINVETIVTPYPKVAAIIGKPARVRYVAFDRTGHELASAGSVPIAMTPSENGQAVPPTDYTRTIDLVWARPGRVTVGGAKGTPLTVEVLREEEVESLAIEKMELPMEDGHRASETGGLVLRLIARHGEESAPLVSAGAVVTSRTPDVCTPAGDAVDAPLSAVLGTGLVFVDAHASGWCQIDVAFGGRETSFAGQVDAFATTVPHGSVALALMLWAHAVSPRGMDRADAASHAAE